MKNNVIKNAVTIFLIIFIVAVVGILAVNVFTKPQQITNNSSSGSINQGEGITLADVSSHNTENDCWVIVGGKVYNATNLIPIHPGGPEKIIPLCGKDATQTFDTRNGKGPHPQTAQSALETYIIGNLQ
jgi:cytochrome b involved in lipid metabolism